MRALIATSAVTLISALMLVSPAQAQTLREKELRADAEKRFESELASINETCGASWPMTWDFTGVKAEDMESYSTSGYCSGGLGALRTVCGSDLGKEAAKAKIKGLACKFGAEKIEITPEGILTYTVDWKAANQHDMALEFLRNNL